MKRFFLVTFTVLLSFQLLNSTVFKKIYHKDYGQVDRTVLVFDEKPNYNVIENQYNIQIEIFNCNKVVQIQDQELTDSTLLQNFTFYQYDNNLIITVALNKDFFVVKGSEYKVESFELAGDEFKVVMDIFSTRNPKTVEEHQGFADFFTSVGFRERARSHLKEVERLRNQQSPEQEMVVPEKDEEQVSTPETEDDQDVTVTKVKPVRGNFFKSILERLRKLDTTVSIIILLILIIIIIILIIVLNRKPSETRAKTKKAGFRNTDGFGDDEFRRKMVIKLAESGWKDEAIAKELNIKIEEVNKILKSS